MFNKGFYSAMLAGLGGHGEHHNHAIEKSMAHQHHATPEHLHELKYKIEKNHW